MNEDCGAEDASPLSPELQQKQAEWIAIQRTLAARVQVPQHEFYEDVSTAAASSDGGGGGGNSTLLNQPDSSFLHDRFELPQEQLHALVGAAADGESCAFSQQLVHDLTRQHEAFSTSGATATPTALPPLRVIGGLDISFVPNSSYGVACLSILSYPTLEVLETHLHHCELTEPYLSGFLAFREVQPVMALMDTVREDLHARGRMPQLLLVDGCGVHHPRRCGLASHLGVVLNIPTIGCAKKMLCVDGVNRTDVEALFVSDVAEHAAEMSAADAQRKREKVARKAGPLSTGAVEAPVLRLPTHPIIGRAGDSPRLLGYGLLTSNSVKKTIYVSPGTMVGFAMAAALVMTMCKHRVVEPVRVADLTSRDYIRTLKL